MKNKEMITAAMLSLAFLISIFALQPEETFATSDAGATATESPRKRRTPRRVNKTPLPIQSPETVQSPRTSTNPMPTPSPETIQSPKPKQRTRQQTNGRKAVRPRN